MITVPAVAVVPAVTVVPGVAVVPAVTVGRVMPLVAAGLMVSVMSVMACVLVVAVGAVILLRRARLVTRPRVAVGRVALGRCAVPVHVVLPHRSSFTFGARADPGVQVPCCPGAVLSASDCGAPGLVDRSDHVPTADDSCPNIYPPWV